MIKASKPQYDPQLTEIIIQLEYLRDHTTVSSTSQQVFIQLKHLLHITEALSSAHIEGNRTTLAAFVGKCITNEQDEDMKEIMNLIEALNFIDKHINNIQIDRDFILELHKIVVNGLTREGDDRVGAFRNKDVAIAGSQHTPPSHYDVNDLIRGLLEDINKNVDRYDELIKIALVHHRFVWIHPFSNGNGRTVRLLTYAMLCKKGYIEPNILRLFSPTAIFAGNRNKYYDMLQLADSGTDKGLLTWCEYFLGSIKDEIEKTLRLSDDKFVNNKILLPAINRLNSAGVLTVLEKNIMERAVRKGTIKASDITDLWDKDVALNTISSQIHKMCKVGYLTALKKSNREYSLNFINNHLTRLVLEQMDKEDLLPIRVDDLIGKEKAK